MGRGSWTPPAPGGSFGPDDDLAGPDAPAGRLAADDPHSDMSALAEVDFDLDGFDESVLSAEEAAVHIKVEDLDLPPGPDEDDADRA